MVFDTEVDHELIFDQSIGRNTRRAAARSGIGSANSVRLKAPFFDLSTRTSPTSKRRSTDNGDAALDQSLTQAAGNLVPYVPDLVFRADAALFGELPWKRAPAGHKPINMALATGITYVGPRPLPYGQRSNTIFTVDANATASWWLFDLGISATNLLGSQYRLGEYNFVSDFKSGSSPTLVPSRIFSAGTPRTVLFSLAVHYGG